MLFSGEYSNGALSIICDDKEEDAGDLLLSYHGNDHYNSVHPIDSNKQFTKSNNAPSLTKNSKQKGESQNDDKTANDLTEDTTQSTTEKSRSRPPTRGSNCPCNSGLKYKKCCMAKEKSKKRLAKHIEKHGTDDGTDNTYEKKEDEFIGDFRVLTI